MATIFSLVASPHHPNLTGLYARLGLQHIGFTSERKAIKELKKQQPDIVLADFVYGYGNNYAGVNVSNLDVFLYSLQKDAPDAKIIVMVDKNERVYVDKLTKVIPVDAVLIYPVPEQEIEALIEKWVA